MKLKPITAIVVLLLLVASLSVSGCTVNLPSTTTPTTTPSAAAPSVSNNVNITNKLAAYRNSLIKSGYNFPAPYAKTTLNGKEAYVGRYQLNGSQFEEHIFPMNSYADALSFKETLIESYKNQGYDPYTSSTTDPNNWYGTSASDMVMIQAWDNNTTLGVPVTWVTFVPL